MKIRVFFFTAVCILSSEICLSSADCPQNWSRFKNKCYKISKNKSEERNDKLCKRTNASLLSIHSEEENMFISAITNSEENYFLGTKLIYNSTDFKWMDGSKFDYKKWKPNFPSKLIGIGDSPPTCVYFQNGVWYNFFCGMSARTICQKDAGEESEEENAPIESIESDNISKEDFCQTYWFRYGDKCLFRNDSTATRIENEHNCKAMNATLLSIDSQRENNLLSAITNDEKLYWLSAERVQKGSDLYRWSDGRTVSQTFWKFPSLQQKENEKAKCVAFNNGKWLESVCHLRYSQLCQKSVLPLIVNTAIPKHEKMLKTLTQRVSEVEDKIRNITKISELVKKVIEMDQRMKILSSEMESLKINVNETMKSMRDDFHQKIIAIKSEFETSHANKSNDTVI